MKYFRLLILIILGLMMVGCFVIPDEPIIEPESPIICEGGSYSIHYSEWCFYT